MRFLASPGECLKICIDPVSALVAGGMRVWWIGRQSDKKQGDTFFTHMML